MQLTSDTGFSLSFFRPLESLWYHRTDNWWSLYKVFYNESNCPDSRNSGGEW